MKEFEETIPNKMHFRKSDIFPKPLFINTQNKFPLLFSIKIVMSKTLHFDSCKTRVSKNKNDTTQVTRNCEGV